MIKSIRRFAGRLLGRRFRTFCLDYSVVPKLVFQELRRILAVIRCKRKYADDPEVLLGRLRTSAHVVDKGLQAENWEEGRSVRLYRALSEQIARLDGTHVQHDPSYRWAVAKKHEYEEAQQHGRSDGCSIERMPMVASKEDVLQLLQSRRSIRSFADRAIDSDTLRELADVVSWSPTSCNRQPAKLFVTQNREKVSACLRQCAGATCFGDATPCFIAACADARFYTPKDRNLPLIDVSLGVQNMLLLASAQGINGTILNWMHHTPQEDAALRKELGIPDYYLIAFNIAIGYSKRSAPAPGRKGTDLACMFVE